MFVSLIGVILEIGGFMSNLGFSIKSLGLTKNAVGTILITSVGGKLKIEDAYAPLISKI